MVSPPSIAAANTPSDNIGAPGVDVDDSTPGRMLLSADDAFVSSVDPAVLKFPLSFERFDSERTGEEGECC